MATPPGANIEQYKNHQNQNDSNQLSHQLPVPSQAVISVEHPAIIKNVDKGIKSLGGGLKLSKALTSEEEPRTIGVSLRPDDPFCKQLLSNPVKGSNVLLKVTVPKRTGRKRKRGSSGPFLLEDEAESNTNGTPNEQSPPEATSSESKTSTVCDAYVESSVVFRSLRDNASKYSITPVGVIKEAHRFRTLPDIQYAASNYHIMTKIRDMLMPLRWSIAKNYDINTASGSWATHDVGPPAQFIQNPVPFSYFYKQNKFIKYTGGVSHDGVLNMAKKISFNSYRTCRPTDEDVPTGPMPGILGEEFLTPYIQGLIAAVRAELAKRPIITRHVLYNRIGWEKRNRIREAAVYCGYFFESGPWRECLIRWGIDPRTHPNYRQYQTVSYLSYKKMGFARTKENFEQHMKELGDMDPEELANEHKFDGVHVSKTGNLFQFCDITDPQLRKILDIDDIRKTCAPTFQGWYHSGTWAKVAVILKDKMNTILGGEIPDNSLYERVAAWPEVFEDRAIYAIYRDEVLENKMRGVKSKEHEIMRAVRAAARNPRYAFEKMVELQEAKTEGVEEEMEDADDVEVHEGSGEIPDVDGMSWDEVENDDEELYDKELELEEEEEQGSYDEMEDEDEEGESEEGDREVTGADESDSDSESSDNVAAGRPHS
ncbi:hypothetical protein K469DRAFT_719860 [Zopfia rhizophila CBS 207.26]|uniref:Transcription factor tfiiic complex a box associated subunit sfc1 n=1 Tax=Zopfia rhizophila CBS 207.26 TaxID=1314779 RepID=A0A6A6DGY4_9PEZI|nr:hypothetical protein K469DRAFT_719860 [Zopfia rhizophila CBS 207.26]